MVIDLLVGSTAVTETMRRATPPDIIKEDINELVGDSPIIN